MHTTTDSLEGTMILRDVPDLHAALDRLLDDHIRLAAPDDLDPQTGYRTPRYWLPCSTCNAVDALPARVVSFVCEDCAAPCDTPGCELLRHEHRGACEPYAGDLVSEDGGIVKSWA